MFYQCYTWSISHERIDQNHTEPGDIKLGSNIVTHLDKDKMTDIWWENIKGMFHICGRDYFCLS